MNGILILITLCVVLVFVLAQIIEPGVYFRGIYYLTGDMLDKLEYGTAHLMFLVFGNAVTFLTMVTAEICAYVMRPASTSTTIQPVCSVGFVVNNIPFVTLNFSVVISLVLQTVTKVFFEIQLPFWFNVSVLITSILVTNKGARAHVATRLRQKIDSFAIGGNNTVHPVVEIALVPPRSLAESAPTLPT